MRSRLRSEHDVAGEVGSGCCVAVGGTILGDHPMGLLRALVRGGITDLQVLTVLGGLDIDLLCGAGCVRHVEGAYVALGPYGLAPNFRRAVEQGQVRMVDFSEVSMLARFRAAALGLPMMPVRSILGSDIMRQTEYVREIECPFTYQPLAALSAARPAVALLHVPECDEYGNVRYPASRPNPNTDEWLAAASERVIVSTERVIAHEAVKREPQRTWIPGRRVVAVVPLPHGAHPGSCNGEYGVDARSLRLYCDAARDPGQFGEYIQRYVTEPADHAEYLARVAADRSDDSVSAGG